MPRANRELKQERFSFEFVKLDRQGAILQRSSGEALQAVEHLAPDTPLELIAIPKGFFQMGARDPGGYPDELPIHPVFVEAFWLGKYPVTQAQWQAVMGTLPDCRFHGANLPVETICWNDAQTFCERLSSHTGRSYALPSEAQWEYACRAGTRTPFSLGETLTTDFANFVGDHTYADAPPGIYRHGPLPVGSFPPNPWGLYDLHGTVWEFCADAWSPDYSGAPLDGSPRPRGVEPGWRVARGGSWHETPAHCRSAMRLQVAESERLEFFGLRVMLKAEL